MPTTAETLVRWIRGLLGEQFPSATNGLWRGGTTGEIRRLGVALAGSAEIGAAAQEAQVDALLLHRPWSLEALPPEMTVLAFHEALDDRLTTGNNPWLADALGFTLGETIGEQQGRPLVVLAHAVQPLTVKEFLGRLHTQFREDNFDVWNPCSPSDTIRTIALANAMRPALIAVAAHQGVTAYLTGTLRPSAQIALLQTPMMAVGLGHEAIERWGLRWLGNALQEQFGLEVVWLD